MHAYLILGNDELQITKKVDEIAKKNNLRKLEFNLVKIADVRELDKFTKLKIEKPTAITIRDIQNTNTETLNAFLKNLEEPQPNLIYILCANKDSNILPTIVSRCQIIRTLSPKTENRTSEIKAFFAMSQGEKLNKIKSIKDRDESVSFVKNIINFLHNKIASGNSDLKKYAHYCKVSSDALSAIKRNGNIQLQLANLSISLE